MMQIHPKQCHAPLLHLLLNILRAVDIVPILGVLFLLLIPNRVSPTLDSTHSRRPSSRHHSD